MSWWNYPTDAGTAQALSGVDPGSGQREFLAPDALHFGYPSVGIEVGYGGKLVAGVFDRLFHPQPVEYLVRSFAGASCGEPLF